MADAVTFPRLVYRGLPDTLGQGKHVNANGEIVGETAPCSSADEFELMEKDGWRLEPVEKPKAAAAAKAEKADKATK